MKPLYTFLAALLLSFQIAFANTYGTLNTNETKSQDNTEESFRVDIEIKNNSLTINNFTVENIILKIYNLEGQIVEKWIIQEKYERIPLHNFVDGKYYYSAISTNGDYKSGNFKILSNNHLVNL